MSISSPKGPLGLLARRACLKKRRPFTTSYHTNYPEYLSARLPVPERLTYAWLRRFHNSAAATLVATPSLAVDLAAKGFTKLKPWTRGVDTELFNPAHRGDLGLPRPVFLYVGRVAVEKNLRAFLDLDLPGSKVVVGDGPALADLKSRYPGAISWASTPAPTWRASTPRPTCSSSRAAPTRSASCCSKRWRAACRWRPTR